MRKIQYNGPATLLGRHGRVQKGSVIFITEAEYSTLLGEVDFEKLEGIEPPLPYPELIVLPQGMPLFDLRIISWYSSKLFTRLTKYSKKELTRIAESMQMLELPVKCSRDFPTDEIIDSIMFYAREAGWMDLSKHEIESSGLFSRKEFEAEKAKLNRMTQGGDAEFIAPPRRTRATEVQPV